MHIEGPQICQINRWNNSFQNMYDMLEAKVDHLAEKTYFVKKKTPKTACLGGKESGFPDFGRTCMPNYWH